MLDAFKKTYKGKDNLKTKRFVLAHEILLSMEGIPAIYIQNLLGSNNDLRKMKISKKFRSVNRKNWDYDDLLNKLNNRSSINSKIYTSIIRLVKIRKKQPAFHPNATQFTLQLKNDLFGIWRQSIDRSQSIFCISNLTKEKKNVSLLEINLISTNDWYDILTGKKIENLSGNFALNAYQSIWLTNKKI